MTVFQKRALVKKALRNVRKANRSLQAKAEVLERVLDRLIDRKTLVTAPQLVQVQKPFQAVAAQVQSTESALRDMLIAAQV